MRPTRLRRALASGAILLLLLTGAGPRADADPPPRRGPRFAPDGPDHALSIVLGRPTDRGIALSVLSATDLEAEVAFAPAAHGPVKTTATKEVPAGKAVSFDLDGLSPDTEYAYRLRTRTPGETALEDGPSGTWWTQRAKGETFTFAVQGDSHPERQGLMFEPDLYVQTLRSVAAAHPDFYVLMGDDFSIDPWIRHGALTAANVTRVYATQRGYLGIVGASSPLFLVNGNHEQAAGFRLDGTDQNAAVLAGRARIALFPLPVPDGFYTGDTEPVDHVGLPRDYVAWTWGDALFVILDPYWHSPVPVDPDAAGGGRGRRGASRGPRPSGRRRDLWQVTLGDAQYHWFEKTLSDSHARYRFVFAHHVLGTGRGGVEEAGLYEWGGKDRDGRDLFEAKRPGWDLPIQDLMAKYGVTIFFQGHDHLFAHQELGGVVYQEVPCPADATYTAFHRDAYRSGDLLPNSGFLRVTVAHAAVKVDYVRSVRPGDEERAHATNGEVSFSYQVPPRSPPPR